MFDGGVIGRCAFGADVRPASGFSCETGRLRFDRTGSHGERNALAFDIDILHAHLYDVTRFDHVAQIFHKFVG